jgi:hypothetical protein
VILYFVNISWFLFSCLLTSNFLIITLDVWFKIQLIDNILYMIEYFIKYIIQNKQQIIAKNSIKKELISTLCWDSIGVLQGTKTFHARPDGMGMILNGYNNIIFFHFNQRHYKMLLSNVIVLKLRNFNVIKLQNKLN